MFFFKVRAKCFHTLDAFVRLIALLVKHSGDQQNTITKVNLLNKVSLSDTRGSPQSTKSKENKKIVHESLFYDQVLGIVAGVLLIDHDVRGTEFQQVLFKHEVLHGDFLFALIVDCRLLKL